MLQSHLCNAMAWNFSAENNKLATAAGWFHAEKLGQAAHVIATAYQDSDCIPFSYNSVQVSGEGAEL